MCLTCPNIPRTSIHQFKIWGRGLIKSLCYVLQNKPCTTCPAVHFSKVCLQRIYYYRGIKNKKKLQQKKQHLDDFREHTHTKTEKGKSVWFSFRGDKNWCTLSAEMPLISGKTNRESLCVKTKKKSKYSLGVVCTWFCSVWAKSVYIVIIHLFVVVVVFFCVCARQYPLI